MKYMLQEEMSMQLYEWGYQCVGYAPNDINISDSIQPPKIQDLPLTPRVERLKVNEVQAETVLVSKDWHAEGLT